MDNKIIKSVAGSAPIQRTAMKTATIDMAEWFTHKEFNLLNAQLKDRLRLIIENLELALRLLKLNGCNEISRNADGKLFAMGPRFADGKIEVPREIPIEFLPQVVDDSKWVETLIQEIAEGKYKDSPTKKFLEDLDLQRCFNTLATEFDTFINESKPFLECEIPVIGHRFSSAVPPIENGFSFSMRRKADKIYTLWDYVEQGTITPSQYESICERIRRKRNIFIVGSTGSGKTTFMNAIADEMSKIAANDRVLTIQEINELQFTVADQVNFIVPPPSAKGRESQVTIETLLKLGMRRSPDRIVVGEIRGGEVHTLLSAWNSGHPGGMCSAHADSAIGGLKKIEQCLEIGGWSVSKKLIAETVHCVISIQKTTMMAEDGTYYAARVVDQMVDVDKYIPELDEYQVTPF